MRRRPVCGFLLVSLCGCGAREGTAPLVGITNVALTYASSDGTAVRVEFDGTKYPPSTQPINLVSETTYAVTAQFYMRGVVPAREVTEDINAQGDEYQIFFTGAGITGPATSNGSAALMQSYADQDINGLPIGLVTTMRANQGSGTFNLTLRHLVTPTGESAKVSDLATTV